MSRQWSGRSFVELNASGVEKGVFIFMASLFLFLLRNKVVAMGSLFPC